MQLFAMVIPWWSMTTMICATFVLFSGRPDIATYLFVASTIGSFASGVLVNSFRNKVVERAKLEEVEEAEVKAAILSIVQDDE